MPDYRLSLLFRIQSLTELDRSKVTAEEKVQPQIENDGDLYCLELLKDIKNFYLK